MVLEHGRGTARLPLKKRYRIEIKARYGYDEFNNNMA